MLETIGVILIVFFVVNIFMSRSLMKVKHPDLSAKGYANLSLYTNRVVWFSIFTGVLPVTIVLFILIQLTKNRIESEEKKKKERQEELDEQNRLYRISEEKKAREEELEEEKELQEYLEERERYRNSPEGKREALLESITDISGVSDKIARTILDQYSTIESIKSATEEELVEIPGVGKGLAKAIKARIG